MNITKEELKILTKKFLTASNRVLKAGFEIYPQEVQKFITFLDSNKVISDFIQSCGEPEFDVEKEVKGVSNSYGHSIFDLGSTDEKEVANIYAVVKYLADNNYDGRDFVYYGYSSSKKYQDKVDGFGNDYIRILINHIESYLYELKVKMGFDSEMQIKMEINNSTFTNSPVSMATDGSSITVTQTNPSFEELDRLITALRESAKDLSEDDKETVKDCIDSIETVKDPKHKKSVVANALKLLNVIKGTTEFAAAVATIIPFVQSLL